MKLAGNGGKPSPRPEKEVVMELRSALQRFRKEHDDILRYLKLWEGALNRAASPEDPERRKGLLELREMEKQLEGIQEHCRAEEENVESPYNLYLENVDLQQLQKEHEELARCTSDFRMELRFATTLRTEQMIQLGRHLLELLRHHIAYEEGLLKQVEDGQSAEDKLLLRYTQGAE